MAEVIRRERARTVQVERRRGDPEGREAALAAALKAARAELEARTELLLDAQDALEESHRRLCDHFEQAPVGFVTLDEAGGVVEVNERACGLLGIPRDRLLGRRLARQFRGRQARIIERHPAEIFTTHGPQTCEVYDAGPSKTMRRLRLESAAAADDAGRRSRCHTVISDVTAQRRTEAEVLQSHKMASLGRLAAGLAHDFGNMLTAIRCCTDAAMRSLPPEAAARTMLEQVEIAALDGVASVRHLLAFARGEEGAAESVELDRALADTTPLLRYLLGAGVDLRVELGAPGALVPCGHAEVVKAVMNLVVNASDAMPDGGLVMIDTRRVRAVERQPKLVGTVSPGEYAALRVSDSGCGMDWEVQTRLFEPFFTTKTGGRGTGIGLTTVRDLVERVGGAIELRSDVAAGTTFVLSLPIEGGEPRR
jgi:PAS domain S-box-containing protein